MKDHYVILAPSGVSFRDCLLGEGATPALAWLDAYGPECQGKKPKWARTAFCKAVDMEELEEYRDARANA
jgi:hypothetical protein